jgi:hypothetical protein
MALTARQRAKLPKSAFTYHTGPRSNWKYPVPTKAQARKAGISEASRAKIHRAALSYSAKRSTSGSYRKVSSVVRKRGTVKTASQRRSSATRSGSRRGRR